MLSKRRELYQGKLDSLVDKYNTLADQIAETRSSLKLLDQIGVLAVGNRVKFYTGSNGVQSGIVLGVDAERERIRVFQGSGLDSKAVTIRAEHILEVSPHVEAGGLATPSTEPSGGAAEQAPPQRRSYAQAESIRIQ